MARNDQGALQIDLMKLAESFKAARVFLTAAELGMFETIGHRQITAEEVAAGAGTREKATEILLNALTSLGLLQKRQDQFANNKGILEMLKIGSFDQVMAWCRHQCNGWHRWSELTHVVRSGFSENPSWSRDMSIDLARTMQLGAEEISERIDMLIDMGDIRSICDLGSGPGAITLSLLSRHPQTTAVLVDKDNEALEIARQDAEARGLSGRVGILNRNILSASLDKQFDVVIVSMVLCLFSRQQAAFLLSMARSALRPGGILLVGELLLNETGPSPMSASLFAVNLLVSGSEGNLFSLAEIRELMGRCGIRFDRYFPTNLQHIIVGENGTN